jgi:drug/metabolite transporter (DMT)-like permease
MIYGVLYFVLSALCFTAMHLLVKACSVSLPSEQLMFWRSATGLIVLTAALPFLKRRPFFFGRNAVPLALRAFFGSLALFAFFKAISLIKVGNATMLCYTYPVFLTVFAAVFLKERFSLKTGLLLAVALAGVVLIIRPKLGVDLTGELIGLASGVLSGLALLFLVLLRRRGESSFVIVYYFFFAGTALSALFAGKFVRIPEWSMAVELLGIGACSLLAQLSMTTGYRHLSAAAGGILSLSVVPFTALGAYLFLSETADASAIIGGILVLVSAGIMTYGLEQRRKGGV